MLLLLQLLCRLTKQARALAHSFALLFLAALLPCARSLALSLAQFVVLFWGVFFVRLPHLFIYLL